MFLVYWLLFTFLGSTSFPSLAPPAHLLAQPVASIPLLVNKQLAAELASSSFALKNYVLLGIRRGFRIGFEQNRARLRSRSSNLRSASQHPEIVDTYLSAELAAGLVAGPFACPPLSPFHSSPFGVIPVAPNSRPFVSPSHSVNDGIPKEPFSLSPLTMQSARWFGQGWIPYGKV